MTKIPQGMKRSGRPVDPHFDKREYLYRRVPIAMWDDPSVPIEVNAVELPDLSVGRSKYGHPEWLRLPNFDGWGVIGITVQDIPPERWQLGVVRFTFKVVHEPDELNYPHSEVRAFEGERHIQLSEDLPEDVHLLWRQLLLEKIKVFLKPHEPAATRTAEPKSFKPELPIPKP